MRYIALISLITFLSGCTISARNHHFELQEYSSKEYDDFNNIWCYSAKESDSIKVCSSPYWARSEYIGVILPIIPQTNRDSRLAYDIKRKRRVEFINLSKDIIVSLTELKGIKVCSDQYSDTCEIIGETEISPSKSVWLEIPGSQSHQFTVSISNLSFKAQLKQFNETKWHLVSV